MIYCVHLTCHSLILKPQSLDKMRESWALWIYNILYTPTLCRWVLIYNAYVKQELISGIVVVYFISLGLYHHLGSVCWGLFEHVFLCVCFNLEGTQYKLGHRAWAWGNRPGAWGVGQWTWRVGQWAIYQRFLHFWCACASFSMCLKSTKQDLIIASWMCKE